MFLIPSFEAVDKTAVEGNAMAAACGCADEVIVVNIATDSQGDAWYNRQKDNVALTTAAENKPSVLGVMRMKGTLRQYLEEVNANAEEMLARLETEMAKSEGVTEALKRQDQMAWVGAMNNIRSRAMEIVQQEVIFV